MMRQRSTTPCRNGPSCYFLRNGSCWFYHPDWHEEMNSDGSQLQLQFEQDNQNQDLPYFNQFQNPRSSPRIVTRSNQALIFHNNPTHNINPYFHNFNNSMNQYQPQVHINQPRRIAPQSIHLSNLFRILNKTQQQKKAWYNLDVSDKQQQQKTIKLNNKQIKLVKIDSQKLHKGKAWFFNNLYHFNHYPQYEQQQCSICISNFQNQQLLSLLFCKHTFHMNCIQEWLKTSDNCPLCRKDFRKHEQFKSIKGYMEPRLRNHLHMHDRARQISVSFSGSQYQQQDSFDQNQYNIDDEIDLSQQFNDDFYDIQADQYHF